MVDSIIFEVEGQSYMLLPRSQGRSEYALGYEEALHCIQQALREQRTLEFTLFDWPPVARELAGGSALWVGDAFQMLLAHGDVQVVPWVGDGLPTGKGGGGGKKPGKRPGTIDPVIPPHIEPPPGTTDVPTYFEVDLLDEIGEAIPGVPLVYHVDGEQTLVTDGSGHTRLDNMFRTNGAVHLEDLDTLRETLRARWDLVREGEWLEEAPNTTFTPLRTGEQPKASLLHELLHTLVIQPSVIRARLLGMYFDTNKCFLLPSALTNIQHVKKIYDGNPDTMLLIVGHTDATGDPSYNDPLSLERADAVAAYLKDNVEAWLAWYDSGAPFEKRWGAHEDNMMLLALPDFATRPPDENPVRWFQRTRGLTEDGFAGTETRQALITEYMGLDGTTLPPNVELVLHGCGENYPLSEEELVELSGSLDPEEAKQQNRRVELYFFDRKLGVQPPPPGLNSPPGSPEYPEWVRRAQETHDFELLGRPMPVFEWNDELTPHLPADLVLTMVEGGKEMSLAWTEGEVVDGFRRFVFKKLRGDLPCSLTAHSGQGSLPLLVDQFINRPDEPILWQHWLEELAQ